MLKYDLKLIFREKIDKKNEAVDLLLDLFFLFLKYLRWLIEM